MGGQVFASHFTLPASCPDCDAALKLVNGTSNRLLAVSVLGCTDCGHQWEITARIVRHARDDKYLLGLNPTAGSVAASAYQRKRRGTAA